MKNNTIYELIIVLEQATNIKRLSFDNDKKLWLIEYKTNLKPDEVETSDLINFIESA